MPQAIPIPKGVDPKLTEAYLLSMSHVLDASVWWTDGDLHAHVTAFDGSVSEREIRFACIDDLGVHQTPGKITLVASRPRAA
jgi:hypothetical protein